MAEPEDSALHHPRRVQANTGLLLLWCCLRFTGLTTHTTSITATWQATWAHVLSSLPDSDVTKLANGIIPAAIASLAPDLAGLITLANELSLPKTPEQPEYKGPEANPAPTIPAHANAFMKDKKVHEVELMSRLVAALAARTSVNQVG